MRLISIGAGLLVVIAAFLLVSTRAVNASSKEPTRVEVWRVGDDGLTLRFTDAIESALKASQNFTLSDGKKEGTLLVTIPTNLRWKRIAGRTRALYAVEFSTLEGLRFDGSTGSCWDNELHKCASQIVRDAKITAGKIRKAGRER